MSLRAREGRRSRRVATAGGIALGLALLLGCTAGGSSSLEAQETAAVANATSAKGEPQHLPVAAEVTIAGRRFELEVARTPEQQRLGLMFRTDLPPDRGMWFPFDPPQPAAFWMFNTPLNLDIIFLHQGRVVYIAANVPGCPALPCPTYGPPPSQLVDSVLEFRGGTAAALGLQVGDTVEIRELSPKAP
ncbi:DUF192 domain-containing protein [Synechococcus sp. R60.4]|uniref:DUF192 domain-containing protein n=1 Tax=unclassified Synechococcus TaxID=2626047 RepID=UPI0039C1CEC8